MSVSDSKPKTRVESAGGDASKPRPRFWLVLLPLLAGVVWAYWVNLTTMQSKWESDPQYSHGYLVPIFAAVLLYLRRDAFHPEQWSASWWGVVLLAIGMGTKVYASYFYIEALNHFSLVIVLLGVVACLWGRRGVRWAWPGVLFLLFMLPLPHRMETAIHGPLRTVGTKSSTYFMQLVGLPAFSEGHVITIGSQQVGVAEACSGLRMLMVFFALSTAVALLISDSWPVRLGLALSAIPIALAANVLRIASTGAMYVYLADSQVFGMPGTEFAHKFFHDWAGWFMIPVALLLLWLEIWILDHLVIRVADRPLVAGIDGPPASRPAPPAASTSVGTRIETRV